MDNNAQMMVYAILGIAVIFFFVASFMSSKTWNWFHVVVNFFVFCAAIGFVVLSAMTLKTHSVWRTEYNRLVADLAVEEELGDKLKYGEVKGAEERVECIGSVRADLDRIMIDRGRVLRGLVLAAEPTPTGTVRLNLPQDDVAGADGVPAVDGEVAPAEGEEAPVDAEDPAVQPVRHAFGPSTIVYAFEQTIVDGNAVPKTYLGEFTITNRDATTIDLKATPDLAPLFAGVKSAVNSEWVLYLIMPADTHRVFQFPDLPREEWRAELKEIFPKGQFADADYESLIDEYDRHLMPADEATESNERTWTKVKFIEAHEVVVDVHPSIESSPKVNFDSFGRAIPQLLRQGMPDKEQRELDAKTDTFPDYCKTSFEPGDTAIFDRKTALELISQKKVEEKDCELVYVRELRDYAARFRAAVRRKKEADAVRATVELENVELVKAAQKAVAQDQLLKIRRGKLAEDLANYDRERAALDALLERTRVYQSRLQAYLTKTETNNYDLEKQFAKDQRQMAAEIDARIRKTMEN